MLAPLALPPTICIDPGHPSEVGIGTRGKTLTELHANWTVAVKLRDLLRRNGYRVVMTKRSEKELVRNRRRAEIANRAHANLMLRLHCDASHGQGFAVYFPDRQGRSEGTTGPSREVIEKTAPIAFRFHQAFVAKLGPELFDQGLMSDIKTAVGSRQGALTGSVFSKVPVVLIEMATLTNAHDEAFLNSKNGQERMVQALAAGVDAALGRKTGKGAR